MSYAVGKYAKAISDRSGLEFPFNEMIQEWNGFIVHKSEFETRHPQDEQSTTHRADAEALKDARPDREEPVEVLVGNRMFLQDSSSMQPPSHGHISMSIKVNNVTVSIS